MAHPCTCYPIVHPEFRVRARLSHRTLQRCATSFLASGHSTADVNLSGEDIAAQDVQLSRVGRQVRRVTAH
jgi:hypothetical protein